MLAQFSIFVCSVAISYGNLLEPIDASHFEELQKSFDSRNFYKTPPSPGRFGRFQKNAAPDNLSTGKVSEKLHT